MVWTDHITLEVERKKENRRESNTPTLSHYYHPLSSVHREEMYDIRHDALMSLCAQTTVVLSTAPAASYPHLLLCPCSLGAEGLCLPCVNCRHQDGDCAVTVECGC